MRLSQLIYLIILIVILSACSNFAPKQTENLSPSLELVEPKNRANADVVFVRAVEEEDRSWTFYVTVSHPDTGWEDYADGWDVVLPDGTVILPDTSSLFTRILTHPHETEQPFTRSQSGIMIPSGIKSVTVRAHDLVDGFGGQEVTVYLDQVNGLNFEVEHLESSANPPTMGLTYQQPDGNRYQTGQIDLLASQPLDIPLAGIPLWVVGMATDIDSSLWVAALEDGQVQAFSVNAGGYQLIDLTSNKHTPGMPPALAWDGEGVLLNDQAVDSADFTHPILNRDGNLVFINGTGDLVLQVDDATQTIPMDALPDGRILSDQNGKLLLLTSPTGVYEHSVLGDALEAKSVTLVDNDGEIENRIAIHSEQVIEGIAPLWVDLNNDGQREIILTLSDRRNGAQLVVFSESGDLIAQGDPIGTGYRWRHQIAVAPFGPNREVELVDVLTPHIGGVVEFFQLQGDKLIKVAEVSGYTSHVINSRNLDMAVAADVNADGQVELLLPNWNMTELGLIQRNNEGAEILGEIPLNGHLTSNLVLVPFPDGRLAVGAGIDSATLRVWLP